VDCVLLDLTMPALGGEQVLGELRRMGLATPVVLMSGYDAQELRTRLGAASVAAFLQKPFRPQELYAALGQALEP
jgi:CheY-like chemotaxis protein